MTIHVIRHGQSLSNISADLDCRFPLGIENNTLTRVGIAETLQLADELIEKKIDIDEIVCSPYTRTKQTAYILASGLATLVPISEHPTFTEIAWTYGDIDALTVLKSESKYAPVDHRLIDRRRSAYTLESPQDVYERVVPAFLELAKQPRNILLVTHFFVVRAIVAFMTEGTATGMVNSSPKNLCLHSFEADDILARA